MEAEEEDEKEDSLVLFPYVLREAFIKLGC